jgi:ATP citrate (pro-S)-lyase
MAAKIDEAANFLCAKYWGELDLPLAFGRPPLPEENHIRQLDSKTGASLKLTVLNKRGVC